MPGKPKHYTPEFKKQAVRKVVDSSRVRDGSGSWTAASASSRWRTPF